MASSSALLLLASALVLFVVGVEGGEVGNAGVTIPNTLVDKVLKAVEPEINAAINNITLPTCWSVGLASSAFQTGGFLRFARLFLFFFFFFFFFTS